MFSSRLKHSEKIFDCIVVYDVSKSDEKATLDWYYPNNYPNSELFTKLPEFILPCHHRSSVSEQYVLLFTDIAGKFDFVVCLLLPLSGYAVCIKSVHPWFELFHSLLNLISQDQLYSVSKRLQLIRIAEDLTHKNGIFYLDVSSTDHLSKFCSPVPDAHCHPFYNRYILEYYNTLSIDNWILIFEVMLLEKSVIFYSSRIHRITSCILASLSLLYPLTWVHLIYPLLPVSCIDYAGCPTPFIGGIHSCMLEDVKKIVCPGVLLVDLDVNKVFSVGVVDAKLPGILRGWLTSRCQRNPPDFTHHGAPVKYIPGRAAATLVKPYLEIMTIILGGYRQAMVCHDSHDDAAIYSTISKSSCANASSNPSFNLPRSPKWSFDRDIFIESRGSVCQTYLKDLLDSQMVIEFMESRVAILNSDIGMIAQDDFEDLLFRLPQTSRSQLSQTMLKGRDRLDRLVRKLNKRKVISLTKAKQFSSMIKGAFRTSNNLEETSSSKATIPLRPEITDALRPTSAAEETDTSDSGDDAVDDDHHHNGTGGNLINWSPISPRRAPYGVVRVEPLLDRCASDAIPTVDLLELHTDTNAASQPDLLSFPDSLVEDKEGFHQEIASCFSAHGIQDWENCQQDTPSLVPLGGSSRDVLPNVTVYAQLDAMKKPG